MSDYESDTDEPLPSAGYRTYEVYQRERVGQTTNLIKPRDLISTEYLADPYPFVETLREHYPCFRDWVANRFWITRYDDVTSVFVDDANFESRPKSWTYGPFGSDLGAEPALRRAYADRIDDGATDVISQVIADLGDLDEADLAIDFAARIPLELLGVILDLDAEQLATFGPLFWRMQRGAGWHEAARVDGLRAGAELAAFFAPLLEQRRDRAGNDLISVCGGLGASPGDLAATFLEDDHETLHGSLANLWFLLLTNPAQLALVRNEPRLMKFAYLEALRHSPAVITAVRYARHEVERFGRLLPRGARLELSAAAANRDPRQFEDPNRFLVERTDLCQREPRGQYRADGLPSGIAFGHGKPSKLPAVPKEQPRSLYALTCDVAVEASLALLDRWPDLCLGPGAAPRLQSLRLGEMHTCWQLPVAPSGVS